MRLRAVFVGEGSSDIPLGGIVARLFLARNVTLDLTTPDLDRLKPKVGRDVESKVRASLALAGSPVDLFIIHRDCDTSSSLDRKIEISAAVARAKPDQLHVSVVPVRMTEAWLLLDEEAIRMVAGNPRGNTPLGLPSPQEAERRANPKEILAEALLTASGTTGRRRDRVAARFSSHRRRLLESLDPDGPVSQLTAWQDLVREVDQVVSALGGVEVGPLP